MNTDSREVRKNSEQKMLASAYCGCVGRRSNEMRAAILTGNEKLFVRALRDLSDRTFGEDSLNSSDALGKKDNIVLPQ